MGKEVSQEQIKGESKAAEHIKEGEEKAALERRKGEEKAEAERKKGEEQSGGIFGWLADKAKAFFEGIKQAIHAAMEAARAAVKFAIEGAQKLATAAIEAARQVIVGIIKLAGEALMAIGEVMLAAFPEMRERYRNAMRAIVRTAENAVNAIANSLKKGVQVALNLLGKGLDFALGLMEKGLMAAVEIASIGVQAAISTAKAAVEAVGAFSVLAKDIASSPGQWVSNFGAGAQDGVRNHLWGAFQTATQEWFNQKVEEVLGLGMPVWKVLSQGGIKTAEVGKMAWDGIKSAIPPALIQILIEKVISMIVPAAGAVLAIIEGLQAAWGTVSRVIQAFDRFMGFLKAVKTGQSGPQFGAALAAAGVVLIDFVSNWLLKRVRGTASKVAGKIKEIAKKIGNKVKGKLGKFKDKFFGKKGGNKDRNNKPGRKSDHEAKDSNEKNDLAEKQRRVDKAVEVATTAVDRFAGKRVGKILLKPILAGIKLSYKLRSLELIPDGKSWTVYGTINPFAKRKTNALVLSEQDAQDIEERINSGDRSVTREEREAFNRRKRAIRNVSHADQPLEPTNPNKSTHGHGHADHGYQTTTTQQSNRIRTGVTPSGRAGTPTSKASSFHSPEAEAEVLGMARGQMEKNFQSGSVSPFDAAGEPTRYTILVETSDAKGFGTQIVKQRDASGQVIRDASGLPLTTSNPTPLKKAKVVFEYVPSKGEWHPLTYYPEL